MARELATELFFDDLTLIAAAKGADYRTFTTVTDNQDCTNNIYALQDDENADTAESAGTFS